MRGLLVMLCCTLWAPPALTASLTASLDRNPIRLDETVGLNLVYTGSAGASEPDLTPLKGSFLVLGSARQTHVAGSGDNRRVSTVWRISLAPGGSGKVTIPSLNLAGATSKPLDLTVLDPRPVATDAAQGDVFIEVQASPDRPYVQARVDYLLRLYRAVTTRGAKLGPPFSDAAEIVQLGSDVGYRTRRGERRYRVVERRYVLFPQRSGKVTVFGPAFRGARSDNRRTLQARAPALELAVRARPSTAHGQGWLPAGAVTLTERWSAPPESMRAGVPITRTLVIEARDVLARQLPEINIQPPASFRQYPRPPKLETHAEAGTLLSRSIQAFSLIADAPGDVTLPAITLDWWNTVTDEPAAARLPERFVRVLATGPPQVAAATLVSKDMTSWKSTVASFLTGLRDRDWFNGFNGAIIAGLAIALAVLIRARYDDSHARAHRRLRAGLKRRDARAVRSAALDWGRATWPDDPPLTLVELGARLGRNTTTLADLDAIVYGDQPPRAWPADQAIMAELRRPRRRNPHPMNPLPHLYRQPRARKASRP